MDMVLFLAEGVSFGMAAFVIWMGSKSNLQV